PGGVGRVTPRRMGGAAMTLLIVLTLTADASMGTFTGYRVGVRIRDGRAQRRQLELFRDLADSSAREVAAGGRVADAVESAAADCEEEEADAEGDAGARLGGQLALIAAQVRLGASPTEALRDRGEVRCEGDSVGSKTGKGSAELVAQDVAEF